jgi:hypothetical protein
MSGGHWDYQNDHIAMDIFGLDFYPNYGERGFEQSAKAGRVNPLEDRVISEMLWDMMCLLHSYDWYRCGDTCEDTYRDDVAYFKKKWMQTPMEDITRRIVEDTMNDTKAELYKSFGLKM